MYTLSLHDALPISPVQKRSVQPAAPKAAPARDAGQPGGAGAAQQSQDDGFGMIIGVMCSDQHIVVGHKPPKCLVAGIASFGLNAAPTAFDRNGHYRSEEHTSELQ